MGRQQAELHFLAALSPAFRREVEASAAVILQKIGSPTVERVEGLAAIAAEEGRRAPTQRQAETAFALAAELTRRARLMKN
jgi:hypothetical protein